MNTEIPAEILINSTRVAAGTQVEIYELVLNAHLQAIECVKIESLAEGVVVSVDHFKESLQGVLFELNHVRVNPRVDNTLIIGQLTAALQSIGVNVTHPPQADSMSVCFKPLGEITDNVRFYFDGSGKMTFLAPKAQLSIVTTNSSPSPWVKRKPGP